jgi:molybdopterin-containing oxidoreductase family membrane subunit
MANDTIQYRTDRRKDFIISLIVGIIALAIGAAGPLRVIFGGNHSDLGSYVTWGLWVSVYVYLVWAEVGMILAYYALKHVLHVKHIEKLGPVIVLTAICALLSALFIIAMDIGHPFRALRVFTDPNWNSPMTWMIWLHTFYVVLLIIEFWAYHNDYIDLIKWLNWVNIPVGVALIAVIGSLFGIVAARPFWSGSMLPMTFLISSLITGTALILLLHLLFSPLAGREQFVSTASELARFLMWAILVGALSAMANLLVTIYPGVPARVEAIQLVLFGPYWWSIWIVHILGLAIPLFLLVFFRKSMIALGVAATLLVLTFVMVPLNLIIPGLAYPMPELQNIADAFQHPRLTFGYFPTGIEWLVVVFAFGLALTLFALIYRLLLDRYYRRLVLEQ